MMNVVRCECTDCINHSKTDETGCDLETIDLDTDGGCFGCEFPKGYWEDQEQQLEERIHNDVSDHM